MLQGIPPEETLQDAHDRCPLPHEQKARLIAGRQRVLRILKTIGYISIIASIVAIGIGIAQMLQTDNFPYAIGLPIIAGGMTLLNTSFILCAVKEERKFPTIVKVGCCLRCLMTLYAIIGALTLIACLMAAGISGIWGMVKCLQQYEHIDDIVRNHWSIYPYSMFDGSSDIWHMGNGRVPSTMTLYAIIGAFTLIACLMAAGISGIWGMVECLQQYEHLESKCEPNQNLLLFLSIFSTVVCLVLFLLLMTGLCFYDSNTKSFGIGKYYDRMVDSALERQEGYSEAAGRQQAFPVPPAGYRFQLVPAQIDDQGQGHLIPTAPPVGSTPANLKQDARYTQRDEDLPPSYSDVMMKK